jgi:hypothetical protein
MRVAAASPEPEPPQPARGSYLAVSMPLILLLLFVAASALFQRPLESLPVAFMVLPAVLIDTRYRYLRTFRPHAVPVPLFDADPDLYDRFRWWRTAMGALTVGVFLGGLTVATYARPMPPVSAFPILIYLTFTTWLTLHTYIKTRNGLRTV